MQLQLTNEILDKILDLLVLVLLIQDIQKPKQTLYYLN